MSGRAFAAFELQIPPPAAQWIAIPTKSVCAFARAAVPDAASCEFLPSFHSGVPSPNTFVMSPVGSVAKALDEPVLKMIELLFSSSTFATPTPPTSQPARVYGTHGAGAFRTAPLPPSEGGSLLTML